MSFRGSVYRVETSISYPGSSDGWNSLGGNRTGQQDGWTVRVQHTGMQHRNGPGDELLTVVAAQGPDYSMTRTVSSATSHGTPRLVIRDTFVNTGSSDLGLAFRTRVHAQTLAATARCAELRQWSNQYPSKISPCIHVSGLYNTSDPKQTVHLMQPEHPSWNPSWWLEGSAADGSGGIGVVAVSERFRLQLDMSESAGFDAVLHNPGLGIPRGSAANFTWMVIPVETDYWEMINKARRVMVQPQTLHARLGFMNWGQITTMARSDLVEFIPARGMRQIVVMGPMSGAPWLGMYCQYLYEPGVRLAPPYTNESFCLDKRAEACAILHSLEPAIGAELECLAPFELAMTPDLPPGAVAPRFPGSVATQQDGTPALANNWGPCVSSHDSSAACKQFIATHGRSYVYILDAESGSDDYLRFVQQKFDDVLQRGFSGAYFDLFSYAYGVGVGSPNPGRFRYTYDRR